MELQAKARHLPFMTASTRLYDKFHISLNDDTFIERAYYIWRSIGNIATELKVAKVNVSTDLVVTLPQDCEFVRSLSTMDFQDNKNFDGSYGDYSYSPKGRSPEVRPDASMTSIEANVRASISSTPGERISYKTYPGYLKIESLFMAGQQAELVYNSIVTGEDGLPLLNDLEIDAIVYMLALGEAEMGLFRKDPGSDKILAYLTPLAERAMCAAKSDEKISDDALDQLLDIKTSWGRKVHNSKMNLY
jgi:hypothetical protein